MRYLTEAEAWREIALEHAERSVSYGCGLCDARLPLLYAGAVSERTFDRMGKRVLAHMEPDPDDKWNCRYAWSRFGPDAWDVRVLAALFLALECEDEAKAAKRRAA